MTKEISDKFIDLKFKRKYNPVREEYYFRNYVKEKKAGDLLARNIATEWILFNPNYKSLTYNLLDSTVIQGIANSFFKNIIDFRIAGKNKEKASDFIQEAYKDYQEAK
jgi:hypothetical protein